MRWTASGNGVVRRLRQFSRCDHKNTFPPATLPAPIWQVFLVLLGNYPCWFTPQQKCFFFKILDVPLKFWIIHSLIHTYFCSRNTHFLPTTCLTVSDTGETRANERTWYLSSRGLRIAIQLRKTYVGKKKEEEEHWVNGRDGREKGREDGRDRHLIMKGKASVSETVSDKNSLKIKDNLLPM